MHYLRTIMHNYSSTIVFLLSTIILLADSRLTLLEEVTNKPATENCAIQLDEPVLEVMERICEMCHELSSHTRPNMRVECRSQCFSTDTFRECLKVFSPRRHSRHLRSKY